MELKMFRIAHNNTMVIVWTQQHANYQCCVQESEQSNNLMNKSMIKD